MSADNFYVIRFHPAGGFAAIMGFASDDEPAREARDTDRKFDTREEAFDWADGKYSEYGVSEHDEVREQRMVTQNVDKCYDQCRRQSTDQRLVVNRDHKHLPTVTA